jgi:hypothetical protein
MRGIADNGLIKIADLDVDVAFGIRKRAEITDVAVATNPDWRTLRKAPAAVAVQPIVEFDGIAADIGVRAERAIFALRVNARIVPRRLGRGEVAVSKFAKARDKGTSP